MIVAVTGATGFLGRRFVARAHERGHEVRALVRPSSLGRADLEEIASLELTIGDVGDYAANGLPSKARELLSGADVLVYLAATGVQARDRAWESLERTNVIAPARWVAAAKLYDVRHVVMAGTALEYEGFGVLPDAPWTGDLPAPRCSEDDAVGTGCDGYGTTKAAGGVLARARASSLGLPMWYLRLAPLVGERDDERKLLPALLRALRLAEPFPTTDGEQVRDWLHLDDATESLMCAMERTPAGAAVLNVGTGIGVRQRDVLERLAHTAGRGLAGIRWGTLPYRKGEPHILVLDPTRAAERLGFQARIGLDLALERLVRSGRETP